jgi:hypothetical protein
MKYLSFIFLAILIFSCNNTSNDGVSNQVNQKNTIPVIFDTDANNELDDQHALAYLFSNRGLFDIRAVTTNATPNGGPIEEHTREALRILKLYNLENEIPLLSGADGRFGQIKNNLQNDSFDGDQAVNFIIEEARKYTNHELLLLPVGKLTNIALAIKKAPEIKENIKIVWLGSNYPEPGEYNQDSDTASLNFLLNQKVPFEMVTVRYGKATGTAAVYVQNEEVQKKLPGLGPVADEAVVGRHGGTFTTFGDYAVSLFNHAEFYGDPPHRSLFDMAAVAIVKKPSWAEKSLIPAPLLVNGKWKERPENDRKIVLWENFDKDAILEDFYSSLENYQAGK